MATIDTTNIETPAEEDARLTRETDARDAIVNKHVVTLEDEGFGDSLHGVLDVVLDENSLLAFEGPQQRRDYLVKAILMMVAKRDIEAGQ